MTIPVAEARARFSQIIDEAVSTHERVEVTKNGRRAAILMSADDYDELNETMDILADADLVRQMAEANEQLSRGEWYSLDDVRAAMREVGRA
ncbi:MAG: type II toxin-antitoxin system Phd/YefM family antitoxin [Propionibacteriaceae bacterium]|nr:type II toxin-antitoxin system Phd/YefM family antitoxin [Propionibacteriaceae bacterium]